MALWDFLKRKKQIEKAKEKRKPVKKAGEVKVDEKPASVEVQKPQKRRTVGFSYEVVKEPHISEKATYLAEKNQYTFKVSPSYNKDEIKKAVEGVYGVDVLSVNIIKIPAKKRRLGRTRGFKKGYAKAVVKIKEGQKIEIL